MTIHDIAAQAGVSISTVSRVINNPASVSAKTAKRVQEIIDQNGFSPYQNTISRNKTTNKILILLPTLSNPFFALTANSMLNTLSASGYMGILGSTEYLEDANSKYMRLLENQEVDGVALYYSGQSQEYLEEIATHYPAVCISNPLSTIQISSVSIDDYRATYEATEYLLKKGHTAIGLVSGYGSISAVRERGFHAACMDYGLVENQDYIVRSDIRHRSGFDYDGGSIAAEKLMNLPKPPTALLVLFDTQAIGAAKYLISKNILPGRDIALIGYDNNPICRVFSPSISSIAQPCYEIGNVAARILLQQLSDKDLTPQKIILPHELILRESCS